MLHFCKHFSRLSETFIYDYITELERQGEDNHVVTLNRVNEESRPFPKINVLDRPNFWHPRRLWHRSLGVVGVKDPKTSYWPQIRERLAKVVRDVNPDVIHAHFGPVGVLIAPVARRMSIPLTVTFYGYDISELAEVKFWAERYSRLWNMASAVTVLSGKMKRSAIDLGVPDEKVRIVHLSRNLEKFPFRAPFRRVRKLLFVGRLVEKKAPLDALEALQSANREGKDLKLHIAGNGPLDKRVKAFIEEHGMEGVVVLHGRVPNDEITDLMHDSDAFILPSKTAPSGDREGTPTVLVEAQAAGLPCVSTCHSGIPEMIPEANHDLLADEGDTEALTDILRSLADRSVKDLKRIAQRGRQKVEEEFSLVDEVSSLRTIYEETARDYARV